MEIVQSKEDFVLIPLANSRGFAKVSPEDMDKVKGFRWHVVRGYAITTITRPHKRTVSMHRMILDPPDWACTDHINHDKLDNRRANLRRATKSQNRANTRGRPAWRVSTYKGVECVSYATNRWAALIKVNGRQTRLGCYDSQEEAAMAYDSAALYFFGEYAYTNFPDAKPAAPEEIRSKAKSRQKGFSICFERKCCKWSARIRRKGFCKFIGLFKTKEEALRAGKAALEIYKDEIARCKDIKLEEAYENSASPALSLTQPPVSPLNVSLANPMNPLNPDLSIVEINFHFNLQRLGLQEKER